MDETLFFKHYPIRKKDSNKFDNGRVFIFGGSKGMAGACILNIIGARSSGASYIDVSCPEEIYPIIAANEITAVYHPDDMKKELPGALLKAGAVAFGSGMTNHPKKKEYLEYALRNVKVPFIIDAEGLHILADHPELYELNDRMILTPHLGEFSLLCGKSIEEINKDKTDIAVNFAGEKRVTLVLKGPGTLIVSPSGKVTVNDSGNEALARAGSGDVLTGMTAGLCALYEDTYEAVCDAVWLHGHLADEAIRKHAKEVFDLTKYPEYADCFFMKRGTSLK
ncbi:MAG: NAD(P)H-hydrate dehydratase [Erysipelotrichaceae bacterium]|nr:NAD(P)H-hydrate dehydratase [Erysipelotrichaceae bacterium]